MKKVLAVLVVSLVGFSMNTARAQQVFKGTVTISGENELGYGKAELLIKSNNNTGNWNSYWSTDHDVTSRIIIKDKIFPNGLYIGTDQYMGEQDASYQIGTKDNLPIGFRTSGVERLRLLANGNVGIGTTSPAYKLSVRGTIQAYEVRVESSWADFVFEPNYRLRPLSEVESHINEHGFLPDMPSAEEVQTNGIGISEANTLLLQKVEELTLYLIEQDKEIKALREEVSTMKSTK